MTSEENGHHVNEVDNRKDLFIKSCSQEYVLEVCEKSSVNTK